MSFLKLQAEMAGLQKELKRLQPDVLALFEAKGVPFAHDGAAKSTTFALAYRESNISKFIILRKGEAQEVVDTAAYITSMGETNETLKAKGFVKERAGTTSITAPNSAQLKSLLELFREEEEA